MQSYSIGLSGLGAAQKALDLIGNNIANASTEGYHLQEIVLSPAYTVQYGDIMLGGGVDIERVNRLIDTLLEQEILNQQSSLGQVECELYSLRTVENAFGELSSDSGLSATIDEFFNALRDLTAHPTEVVWQSQAVTAADAMAGQFRGLVEFLSTLNTQIMFEAQNNVEQVNTLVSNIAALNHEIQRKEVAGAEANNLRDQRDQAIKELSELVGVETQAREFGVVDVSIGGLPAVTGTAVTTLETGLNEDGELGISVAGEYTFITDVESGKIGGLFSLKNEILSNIRNDLDSLASAIITQINQIHVQGVGSEGSFTQLTGWKMPSENLADFEPQLADGKIYIRVTDTNMGAITRHEITVDATTDSLSSIAADITTNIVGLTAFVTDNRLNIVADADYEFDFLPAVLSGPTASTLNGSSPPAISVSGIYTGAANDTFVFAVSGAGSVGNGDLLLEVKDGGGAGDVIAVLNIGSGYVAQDPIDVGNGIKIYVGAGNFAVGDSFEVDAFANTDTSGLLAAIGMNTFFQGSGAGDMAVRPDILDNPGLVATAAGADMTDNTNVLRMAALQDQSLSTLSDLTPGEFYRRLVTDLGQDVQIKEMRAENIHTIAQNLAQQQSEFSGVDINEQAAQMLVFEQMFNAMARYLETINSSILALMQII